MAFLIAGLIALFLVGCFLYGIYAGIGAVVRGASRAPAKKCRPSSGTPAVSPEASQISMPEVTPEMSPDVSPESPSAAGGPHSYGAGITGATDAARATGELKELFELHQSGALTAEEFAQMKQYLLFTLAEKLSPRKEMP